MSRLEGTEQVKRIRNLMSALLGRTDRHDVSNVPPLRVSQLRKAALVFLAAASGVFFVCAPAGAIEITSMTPSSSDAIEGDSSHYITIETDVGYAYVKWYVNNDYIQTNTGDGSDLIDYLSGYEYYWYGSTHGNQVTVKAVAYRNAEDHDSETVKITVWDPIRINFISPPSRYVEGETIQLSARTNIPYSRVDFYVNSKYAGTASSNGQIRNYASISHILGDEARGTQAGSTYPISATAYATVAGKETSFDKTGEITVFGDNGYIWKRSSAEVVSFSAAGAEHKYELTTWHSVSYYNDTGETPIEKVKTRNAWRVGTEEKNAALENDGDKDEKEEPEPVFLEYDLTETLAYAAYMGFYRSRLKTLTPGNWYGGYAYTNLHSDGQAQCRADSSPKALEYDEAKQLPSGGLESKTNSKPEAQFLFK